MKYQVTMTDAITAEQIIHEFTDSSWASAYEEGAARLGHFASMRRGHACHGELGSLHPSGNLRSEGRHYLPSVVRL